MLIEANQFDAPVDANGLYASRQEMKTWGYNERGEPSKTGACLDCLRMINYHFRTYSEPLTMREEFYRLLPESAKVKKGQVITLEQHMSIQLQREIAAEKLAEKFALIDEEAEEDGNDFYWGY